MPPKLSPLDGDKLQPLQQVGNKAGGRSPSITPQPQSSRPSLLPLRASPAKGGSKVAASPNKPKMKPQSLPPEALVKALRADLFQLQALIDGKTSRSILNYNQRKLEAEILLLQQQASSSEKEALDLLGLLSAKCSEAGELLNPSPAPTAQQQQQKKKFSLSGVPPGVSPISGGKSQQGQGNETILSDLFQALKLLQNSSHATGSAPLETSSMTQLPQAGGAASDVGNDSIVNDPGSPHPAAPQTDGKVSATASGEPSSSAELSQKQPSASPILPATSSASLPAAAAAAVSGSASEIPVVTSDRFGMSVMSEAGPTRMAPMSAGSLASLKAVGVGITLEEDSGDIDTEQIVRQLVAAARKVKNLQDKLDHRLKVNQEAGDRKNAQSRLELEAKQSVLQNAEHQIDELKKNMNSSRFGPNLNKSLATVHDAPMSFQVEQQYQRDIKRAHLRVQELEEKYQQLWDSGIDDRESVKRLKAEGIELRDTIKSLKTEKGKAMEERDEQATLFKGVSQARGEEARMSLVAVKQLESRIEELEGKLKAEETKNETLSENFKALFGDFNRTERLLVQARNRLECTVDTFNDYKSIYNQETVETVHRLQGQLLQTSHKSDQQEAMLTLQKQQLEDNEVLRNLTVQESGAFMERLKASTEWKMINVRANDEARQLGMRLVALTSDREKKENSMAMQHSERLELYKERAAQEISDRKAKRLSDIKQIDPSAIESDYKSKHMKRQQHLEKQQQSSRPVDKVKQSAKLKEEYSTECQNRVVTFSAFYLEKFPNEDE